MTQRVTAIDSIRGFSLFGILLVNTTLIQFGMFNTELPFYVLSNTDKSINGFVQFFGTHNFITLFSFLFGLSIVMLQKSSIVKEKNFFSIYLRRIVILLTLGYIHGIFIWEGDILFGYGIIGILLAIFINRKPRTILIWAFILLVFSMCIKYFFDPTSNMDNLSVYSEKAQYLHKTGSYIEHLHFRLNENAFEYLGMNRFLGLVFVLIFVTPLPMFLFGMYVGKKGWLFNVDKYMNALKIIWLISGVFSFTIKSLELLTKHSFLTLLTNNVTPISMALFYGSSIILLAHYKWLSGLLFYMANMGKMSVSNYLMQTIIVTTIFYGYGIGLYGKGGYLLGLVLTIGIYLIQLYASTYWLQKYRMGPIEYIWRLGTYLEKPMFKRSLKKAS
ncbi:DUF418 domain-containing protein [Bacillus cereus]|uniref:DUF418 domain-containing protein n=2 Tax=Bacillus cereus group TaxID=86661 RepID=A0A9W5KQR5_BACCE|nr:MULTISPECIES: DUF418 domain-containing protein [Bacillus cereus group]MEB8735213.1 DUF418 domain-containing protein [Bacillus cereus]EEM44396.1 hypothetical protein bthur0005_58620 [Bacillus thuringiensis serovar pakistani str. T13001]EJR60582.1 hypothetical protein IK5_06165 [Bacillus cereus VD154]KIU72799.1 hypothetical protein C797_21336 [Bacillus thuringiensis Sbt003]MEB8752498.1 DUF418 domain-containing protein [Bacillus cereus]